MIVDPATGTRSVVLAEYRYCTQDPVEETPAGFRASRGAQIIWVEQENGDRVARIEDGRVFRGKDL